MATDAFYLHDHPAALRFEIRGALSHELADAMLQSLKTARSIAGGRTLLLDLRSATRLESAALGGLARLAGFGARFLVREDHLPLLAPLLQRSAAPAGESPQPGWRRALCRAAAFFRRSCRCLSCARTRFWML